MNTAKQRSEWSRFAAIRADIHNALSGGRPVSPTAFNPYASNEKPSPESVAEKDQEAFRVLMQAFQANKQRIRQ